MTDDTPDFERLAELMTATDLRIRFTEELRAWQRRQDEAIERVLYPLYECWRVPVLVLTIGAYVTGKRLAEKRGSRWYWRVGMPQTVSQGI